MLIMLAAAVIWGFGFAFQKAAASISPFTLTAIRSYLAFAVLIPSAALFDKLSGNGRHIISRRGIDFKKTELIGGAVCGAVLFIAANLQQMGIGGGTDAGKASFITALYVVIVPVLGLFLGRRAPLQVWISVICAVAGFYLLCMDGGFSIAFSDLLLLVCASVYAVQIIAIDKSMSYSGTNGVRLSCIQFLVCGTLSLICALIFERGQELSTVTEFIPELLFLGILSSGAAYTLQILAQQNTPPAVASILLSLESVFGAIAGSLVLGEKMRLTEYIGCGIIFAAVIFAQLEFKGGQKAAGGKPTKTESHK